MTIMEAIDARHSVRAYKDMPIPQEVRDQLDAFVSACNEESGLSTINTCWTALTFNKRKVKELVPGGEKLCMVIALGYGETQGTPHKSKSLYDVIDVKGGMPEWFVAGVESALKAPTAVNQQKFCFMLENDEPSVKVRGIGTFTKVDLGIAAYHFEAAAGKKVNAR